MRKLVEKIAISLCRQLRIPQTVLPNKESVMIIDWILFAAALFAIASLCFHHWQTAETLACRTEASENIVREAADKSIEAFSTVNPVIALVRVTEGVQMLESLFQSGRREVIQGRLGAHVETIYQTLLSQKRKVVSDVMDISRGSYPEHPLMETYKLDGSRVEVGDPKETVGTVPDAPRPTTGP